MAVARPDFMLDVVCREAESVLLDFVLPPASFRKFSAMLDQHPKNNPKLWRLLAARALWEK